MRSAWLTVFGLLALATPGIVARIEAAGDDLDGWLARQPIDRIVTLQAIGISGMFFIAAAVSV